MKKKRSPLGTTKSFPGVYHNSSSGNLYERVAENIPPPGSIWSTSSYKGEDVRFLHVIGYTPSTNNLDTLPHGTIILITGTPHKNYLPFLGPKGPGWIALDWWSSLRIHKVSP